MTSETQIAEQLRDEYLGHVEELYCQARDWVRGLDPEARLTEESVILQEEPVDPYEAKVLVIGRPGRKTVRMIPRGRWIIGAEGRVDLKSDLGSQTLVYVADGGPAIRVDLLTESGRLLEEGGSQTLAHNVAEGWVFVQNRQIGLLPALSADLFHRLLEVLGR